MTAYVRPQTSEDISFVLRNEFANIRISTEAGKCGNRLRISDLETGMSTYLDLLELSSLCELPEQDRMIVVASHMYQLAGPQSEEQGS